jgi:hypothetical protein
MKTTAKLPDADAQRVKITATQKAEALARLREGFHLGGKPLPREIASERRHIRALTAR